MKRSWPALLVCAAVSLASAQTSNSVGVRRVDGARTARQVHRQLRVHRARLEACQSSLCGTITADVEIDAAGRLRVVRTRLSDWDEQRAPGQCVSRALERIEFPPAASSTTAHVIVRLDRCMPAGITRAR